MAPGGSCSCCFPRQNLFPLDYREDKLAIDPGPTDNSYSGNTSLVPFCNPTPIFALVSISIPALVFILALALGSSDELFKQFMKVYLKF